MKKKIIASTVLVVYMILGIFTLAACGGGPLDDFSKAISETSPSVVNGSVTMHTELGVLKATYTATIAEDGSCVVEYEYESFNQIGD